MFGRMFRELAFLYLLVILVSGLPRHYSRSQLGRDRRHASCPSCSRDCPDALANWYAMPPRKEFHGLGQQISPSVNSQAYQPSLSFFSSPSPYDGALRSRGTPFIEEARDTYKRENPFTYQRRFDSDLAPASSAPFYGVESPMTSYELPSVGRSLSRSSYQKPSFFDVIRPQPDVTPANAYSNYQSFDNVPTSESINRPIAYGDSGKFQVVYRADRYPDESSEDAFEYPKEYDSRDVAGLQMQEGGCGCQRSRMNPYRDLPMVSPQTMAIGNAYQQSRTNQYQDSLTGPQLIGVNANYLGPREQTVEEGFRRSPNYNSGYQAQSIGSAQVTSANSNVYPGFRGQQIGEDLLKNVDPNAGDPAQVVGKGQITSVNSEAYPGQREQQFNRDSRKSGNYNTGYQIQPVGADQITSANVNSESGQREQQFEGASSQSVNYHPRYQPRAIKVMDNGARIDDGTDSRRESQEELKGKRDAVGEQSNSKKLEKSTNPTTETTSADKVTESKF